MRHFPIFALISASITSSAIISGDKAAETYYITPDGKTRTFRLENGNEVDVKWSPNELKAGQIFDAKLEDGEIIHAETSTFVSSSHGIELDTVEAVLESYNVPFKVENKKDPEEQQQNLDQAPQIEETTSNEKATLNPEKKKNQQSNLPYSDDYVHYEPDVYESEQEN